MPNTINRISSKSVQKATGKTWDEWLKLLDKLGAQKMVHKDIAKMLHDQDYIKSDWWCQMVTVGYEYARGMRVTGQTETQGYEIGVQKTIMFPQKQIWDLLTSETGLKVWLGDLANINFKKGQKFKTKEGNYGEIRTVEKATKLRLSYHPKFLKKPSTLQIYLLCHRNTPNKTNVRFHQEKLSDKTEREKMRKHWQQALEKLESLMVNR